MGAVSFSVGAEGSTYEHGGVTYTLTGWTLGAIANHERFLEQRAYDAIARLKMTPDARATAIASLAEDIACFTFAYGGERFSKSLLSVGGLAHFAWQLMKPAHESLTLDKVIAMVNDDAGGLNDAVYNADPRNRVTAETIQEQNKLNG